MRRVHKASASEAAFRRESAVNDARHRRAPNWGCILQVQGSRETSCSLDDVGT